MQGNSGLDPKFVSPTFSYKVKGEYKTKGIKAALSQFKANILEQVSVKSARITHLFENIKTKGLFNKGAYSNYFNNKGLINTAYAKVNDYEMNGEENEETLANLRNICSQLREKGGVDSEKINKLEAKINEAEIMGPLNGRTNEVLEHQPILKSFPTFLLKEST